MAFSGRNLNERGEKGRREDTAYLLGSLLLAFSMTEMEDPFEEKEVRVSLGAFRIVGHAWVEAKPKSKNMGDEWFVLESTSDQVLTIGENAWPINDAYDMGYEPEIYVYHSGCKLIGKRGLYIHYPLQYPARADVWMKKLQKLLKAIK